MHLSLLSDGFVSDCFDDAGAIGAPAFRTATDSSHFMALCRGVIVLVVLAIPVGMTFCTTTSTTQVSAHDDATGRAAAATTRSKAGG